MEFVPESRPLLGVLTVAMLLVAKMAFATGPQGKPLSGTVTIRMPLLANKGHWRAVKTEVEWKHSLRLPPSRLDLTLRYVAILSRMWVDTFGWGERDR